MKIAQKKLIGLIIFLLCLNVKLNAQMVFQKESFSIQWDSLIRNTEIDGRVLPFLYFDGVHNTTENGVFIPVFTKLTKLKKDYQDTYVKLENLKYELCTAKELEVINLFKGHIGEEINIKSAITKNRKISYLSYHFTPIFLKNGSYYKLTQFDVIFVSNTSQVVATPKGARTFSSQSVLTNGKWYKIAVSSKGIYKLDKAFFKEIGVDIGTVNPKSIRVYGNGGGMSPFKNSQYRHDDLKENPIYVEGESDGVFNDEDYVLFYGQEQTKWNWSSSKKLFEHQINYYCDTTYYFLNFDLGQGKRIIAAPTYSGIDTVINSFQDYIAYENDLYNLLRSGREWYGESFSTKTSYDFSFTFPNILNTNATIVTRLASHSVTTGASFDVLFEGNKILTANLNPITGSYLNAYAADNTFKSIVSPNSPTFKLTFNYNKANNTSVGWLNYIEINCFRDLKLTDDPLFFRHTSKNNVKAQMILKNSNALKMIWDITDPLDIRNVSFSNTSTDADFITLCDTLREFVAFKDQNFSTPKFLGEVSNQNLHSLSNINYVVVTHPRFLSEAQDIASFHAEKDGLKPIVVTTEQIYNEFSSGAIDITAIKDFLKMLYDRAGADIEKMPRYLLLLGDGSYDNKGKLSVKSNLVPTYQSLNSLDPANGSYVSDDYIGLLDDTESELTTDIVDVAIGRWPVNTRLEAQQMVAKVKYYYEHKTQKNWRNTITFIGDDEDSNEHVRNSETLAKIVRAQAPEYNIDKIYLDAYEEEVSSGGQRYPAVNEAISKRMEKGCILLGYIGHGGELGWAHERVLSISEVNGWTNKDNMPAMVTATCEFSRFDDPLRTAAGELVLLNPDGGAIGLLTTTRLVYSSSNADLTENFYSHAFDKDNAGNYPRLGDLARLTKSYPPFSINSRNFCLLGDPAVQLVYPTHKVYTTICTDTMKALSKITVKGYVGDDSGVKLSSYNGIVYPTVFDKPQLIQTLNNNGDGVFKFKSQKNVVFNGRASIKNGDFEFSFVVPKDIVSTMDTGRISYYISDQNKDGNGYYEKFNIGGLDSNAAKDDAGPKVDLFMNDETFVFGGITNQDPYIYAVLNDESGINTTGNGIGHDIVAILDDNISQKITLNDFYEAELDSYQKGKVKYPLKNLTPGKHTLRFKAFDVQNNSGEAYTEFLVSKTSDLQIDHVLNYPNPFTTHTGFYFEHNMPGSELQVILQIFSVSGKLVKSFNTKINTTGYRVGPIEWDGKDEYGDWIGKGVYIYKLKVVAPNGKKIEKIEKLVILK